MGKFSTPEVPFVEAAIKGGRQKPSLIVLHSSFTPTKAGAAWAIALANHRSRALESVHYLVDEEQAVRCVKDNEVALFGTDIDTKHTLGVELCDDPSGSESRWDDKEHEAMLNNLADLVAQLCLAYGIKPRFLAASELSRWRKWRKKSRGGIVTYGFLSSTYWPESYFMKLVKAHIEMHKLAN